MAGFADLATGVHAASLTIARGGFPVLQVSSGLTNSGGVVGTDTPMVTASLSKLVTALSIARLVQRGALAVDQPVPWSAMGLAHDPRWDDVTVRELLDHTSGMPIVRRSWLTPGDCAVPLTAALAAPPRPTRGEWTYSNGNYCALGLLVEHLVGAALDVVGHELVFAAAGVGGAHVAHDGALPDDAPYVPGVARLERLGGAGVWVASTDDMAAVLSALSADDMALLRWPGVFADQYGWGHTGTLDGAKACAWVLLDGTVMVAIVAGDRPSTGGGLCDALLPALASDLGWGPLGEPDRSPR